MQNNTNDRVTPLKSRGNKADATPKDSEWVEWVTASSRTKMGRARVLGSRLLWVATGSVAILFFILIYYRNTPVGFQNVPNLMAQKLETLSTLRIHFLKSIEAEKLAVMAETDEASVSYADESKRASESVETDLKELSRLIGMHPAADESNLLQEFEAAWEQVRKIDGVILDLSVQNTNLKAFRLSFGKGRDAVERFENALNALTRDVADIRLIRAAADALSAELTILALQAPHIVSPDEREMNQIEQVIHAKEEGVRRSLEILARLAPADRQSYVNDAESANHEFAAVTATVVELSRKNTNVNSLNISLDRKQKVTALCEALLDQLHKAFMTQAFKATR
jgi:hypothetical protein